ncbi:hypothetical protein [uncultured Bradyrhizobium sp.]|uniref:hypothetical protein n=1 Tax=uncultured Bradyrhizobium sp. TaxID=199684 RepID=UPI00261B7617|nr:hypothetical protein [uncultured Bradyrhizobium sp.]
MSKAAILTAIAAAAALLSLVQPVAAQSDLERQAQCELSAIRDTRSPLAVQTIRSACNWLVVNGDSLLNASTSASCASSRAPSPTRLPRRSCRHVVRPIRFEAAA